MTNNNSNSKSFRMPSCTNRHSVASVAPDNSNEKNIFFKGYFTAVNDINFFQWNMNEIGNEISQLW